MRLLVLVCFILLTAQMTFSAEAVKPVVTVILKPIVIPAPQVVQTLSEVAQLPEPVVVKDVSAAPPQWMQDMIVTIKSLPVIGPVAVKILNWIAVIVSILTALCAFLMVVTKALSGISSVAQFGAFGEKIKSFQDGKIMYYLKYLSMFNAKKPEVVEAEKAQA